MKLNFFLFFFIFQFYSFSQKSSISLLKDIDFSKTDLFIKNDTITIISSNFNNVKSKPTILFLQGSTAIPIIYTYKGKQNVISPFEYKKYLDKFNFVFIARKGIPFEGEYEKLANTGMTFTDANGKEPKNYIANNNIFYRTFQAKTVLNYLYKQKWVKKDSIFVIGHSEGYRVAAKLSEGNNRIAKLVCMSANPFNRLSEEIYKERIKSINVDRDSIYQSKIDYLIKNFKEIGDDIAVFKNDYKTYNWASYELNIPAESFKKYSNPILVVYGTNDNGSLQNDLLPFLLPKQNLSLKVYSDFDHNYFKKEFDKDGKSLEDSFHWDEVFSDVVNWLLKAKK